MTRIESTHQLDIEFQMHTPNHDLIDVRLTEVRALSIDGQVKATIIGFQIPADQYTDIINPNEYFNSVVSRREGNPRLRESTPIEYQARLVEGEIDLISGKGDRASDVAEFFKTASEDSPLLYTENWLALEVKQEVPVPPDVGQGTLKEGYRLEQ